MGAAVVSGPVGVGDRPTSRHQKLPRWPLDPDAWSAGGVSLRIPGLSGAMHRPDKGSGTSQRCKPVVGNQSQPAIWCSLPRAIYADSGDQQAVTPVGAPLFARQVGHHVRTLLQYVRDEYGVGISAAPKAESPVETPPRGCRAKRG